MAFDLSSITAGPRADPVRCVIYGPHGVGKTSFSAQWPNPVFVQTEDGLGLLETPAFPLCASLDDALECFRTLHEQDHEFKTVVLDSADWLDNFIGEEIRANHTEKELAYGKDGGLCAARWKLALDWLNALRRDRKMHCVLVAHCEIKQFNPPDGEAFERYQPKLIKPCSALMQEWADAVLFANFRTIIKTEEPKDKRKEAVKKAVATGERLLHTGERPAYLAKNRYSLPEVLPMDWAALKAAMPIAL